MKKIEVSKDKILDLLKFHSRTDAAKIVGCHAVTFRKKCKEYGIPIERRKYTFKEVKEYFEEQGCKLLEEEYFHNKHPMKYRCACGNTSIIKFIHFKNRGQRCKQCRIEKFIGKNNPNWNHNKTDEERMSDRKYFEYKQWIKEVFERDDYTCQICKKKGGDLNAHHLFGYDRHTDKRTELDNGITLCVSCHENFHKIYGYGKNTREQFVNSFFFHLNETHEWEFIEATEECARSVFKILGCGDSKYIDKIAVDALRSKLNSINFSGKVIICEGKKDGSYGMYNEHVGKIDIPTLDLDIACDPVDGSTRSSNLQSDACSILTLSSKGSMYVPKTSYMKKIIMRKDLYDAFEGKDILNLQVKNISDMLKKLCNRIPIICLLKRDRNNSFIDEFRKNGCKIQLIDDCDVLKSIEVFEGSIDLYYGYGGAPETILATSAANAYGGKIQSQEVEKGTWKPIGDILKNDNMINGYSIFISTGITDSNILNGVKENNGKIITQTLFASDEEKGTIRKITTSIESHHGN